MSSQYTVNGLGLPGPNPWSIILTGWATGLIIRRVEISYYKNNVANHLEGFATLSRCSTPTPGVAVTVVSVVDQSAVTAQATAMTGALSISTTLASVTSWAMSNSESVVRDFGDGQALL